MREIVVRGILSPAFFRSAEEKEFPADFAKP
jgi:hypothetical protein